MRDALAMPLMLPSNRWANCMRQSPMITRQIPSVYTVVFSMKCRLPHAIKPVMNEMYAQETSEGAQKAYTIPEALPKVGP